MSYFIGLDIGTSAIKGVLLSTVTASTTTSAIIAKESSAIRIERGQAGEISFDAEELFQLTCSLIKQLAQQVPDEAVIAGISLSSASGNTLLVDEAGQPLTPVFSWMDTRVTDELEHVLGTLDEEEVHELIGWPKLHTFPLAHLAWLKYHQPELLQRAAHICMSSDYILYRLTGLWGIDSSTATTFYLQDQKSASWHLPYLQKLEIAVEKLPTIYRSGTKLGNILPRVVADTGLSPETVVVLGAFDHPSAARGADVLEAGQLLLSCGTSWVGFYPLHSRADAVGQQLLTDPFLQPEGSWGGMFSLSAIALAIDRYVCLYISDSEDRHILFSKLAATASPGAEGLLIHPQLASSNQPLVKCTTANIARALMEGTVYLLRMKLEQLRVAGLPVHSITMVGGPSESIIWPQITANILATELHIVNGSCAGATGSAILAAIGAGYFHNERDAWSKLSFDKQILQPDSDAVKQYELLYQQFIEQFDQTGGV